LQNWTPEEAFAVLRSANSATPDPRLDGLLDAFKRQWLEIARKRYARLHEHFDDLTQDAVITLLSPERLDQVRDVAKLERWARQIFVRTVLDLIRKRWCEMHRRVFLGTDETDPEDFLRQRVPCPAPTPEDLAEQRQRLSIVGRLIDELEVAKLKFVDGLPDRVIAERLNMSRDGVAGQLKRLRAAARRKLE